MPFAHRRSASSGSVVKRVVNDTDDCDWWTVADDFGARDWVISWLTMNNTIHRATCGLFARDGARRVVAIGRLAHRCRRCGAVLDPMSRRVYYKVWWRY